MKPLAGVFLIVAFLSGGADVFAAEPLKIRASTLIGADSNPSLNSEKNEDLFAEESVSLDYKHRLSKTASLRWSYDLTNVNYFEVTDENVLYQKAGAGLDLLVAPKTVLETDYTFEYVYFPYDESVTNMRNNGRVGLRYRVTDKVTWRGGVGVTLKDYEDRHIREGSGVVSDSEERSDDRYKADMGLRIRLNRDLSLWGGFTYYMNDSNDQFHDTYDYESYKVHAGASFRVCSKVRSFVRASYENRDYDSRSTFENDDETQGADLYVGSAGLYYQFHKNVSLGAIYTYRVRSSNEPSQGYTSSVTTVGLYYTF
ncbi:MAG TPA: hypothetical protein VD883_02415 [Candidatus Omnitrophota bacterium]|nr:hypothetical protein [Candidatus Omnitrophota bacterium]